MATIPADVIRIQEDTVQQVKDHPLKLGQLGFAKVDRIIVYRIKDGSGYIEFPDSLALQAVVDQVNELEEAGWETVYEETVPSSLNGISFLETEAGVYTGTADIRITALSGGVVQGSIKYSIIIESNVAEAISYTVNGFEQNIGSPSTIYYDPVDDKVKICFIAITTATMKVEISSSTGLNAVTSVNSGSAIALLAWDISKNESFNNTLYYPTLTGATTTDNIGTILTQLKALVSVEAMQASSNDTNQIVWATNITNLGSTYIRWIGQKRAVLTFYITVGVTQPNIGIINEGYRPLGVACAGYGFITNASSGVMETISIANTGQIGQFKGGNLPAGNYIGSVFFDI